MRPLQHNGSALQVNRWRGFAMMEQKNSLPETFGQVEEVVRYVTAQGCSSGELGCKSWDTDVYRISQYNEMPDLR